MPAAAQVRAASRADTVPGITTLSEGTIIGGRYGVIELLGDGMSGCVYRARQIALGRDVAVKLLHPSRSHDRQYADRFRAEARMASAIDSPHTAAVYDCGEHDGSLYMAMQLIRGRLLRSLLDTGAPLAPEHACELCRQIADGLAQIHEAGIVHADLKPSNVALTTTDRGEHIVLLDFGISRFINRTGSRTSTREELVAGTPGYLAPEVATGQVPTPAADIYAASVILFELLTGEPPYEGESLELVRSHCQDPIPLPSSRRPGIWPELDAICARGMAKDAAERFADARQLERALAAASSATTASVPSGAPHRRAVEIPFVGRRREVERVAALFDGTAADSALQLVGPPGSGRSSVVVRAQELAAACAPRVFSAGAHPSGLPVPYAPIRELLARLVGMAPSTSNRVLARALRNAVGTRPGLTGVLELIEGGTLTGALPPSQRRDLCLHSTLALIARLTDRRTTLVFDDADQYDGASREIVAALAGTGVRMLIVTEPDVELLPGVEQLALPPLDETAVSEVAACLTSGLACPPTIESLQRLGGRSPAHLTQLARCLLDDHDHAPPATFADAVLARLRHLPDEVRALIEATATNGRLTERSWLASIADILGIDDIERALDEALASGLVAAEGADAVRPACARVRDLVGAAIPPARRRALHRVAARRRGEHRDPPQVRGRHLLEAGLLAEGAGALCEAGALAQRFAENAGALATYRDAFGAAVRARDALPSPDAHALVRTAGIGLARAYCELDRADSAAPVLETICETGTPDGDPLGWSHELIEAWANVAFARGDTADAIHALDEELRQRRQEFDPEPLLRCALRLAEMLHAVAGPLAAARALDREADAAVGDPTRRDACCHLRASASGYLLAADDVEGAVRTAESACAAAAGLGNPTTRWRCLATLARALEHAGEIDAANEQLERAGSQLARASLAGRSASEVPLEEQDR